MDLVTDRRSNSARIRPAAAVILIVLAAAAWAFVLLRQSRSAPVDRYIEAGREYILLGDSHMAEKKWREALRLDPNNTTAWIHLAGLYSSTDNWPAGVQAYRELLRLKADRPRLHSDLAVCLLRSGDELGAYKESLEELKRDPNDIPALTISAQLASQMGELQREADSLQRLRKLEPENVYSLTLLAENLTFSHDYVAALSVLNQILRLDPNNSEAYALRGVSIYDSDRSPAGLDQAEQDFQRSLKANALAPFPRLYLGKIYRQRGDNPKALFQLEAAQRLMPFKRDIYFELAAAYAQAGKPNKAARARQTFEQMRRQADLVESLKKKCSVNPDDFEDHLKLGVLAMREADYHVARACLDKAHALRPADPQVNVALAQMARITGQAGRPVDSLRPQAQ
jgi:tetratricopeptide (TPR) repeat protein